VLYILHSTKTDPDKFGGGSTEKYVFTNGSSTIVAEANYSGDASSSPVKTVFDSMLSTFKFTPGLATGTSTLSASTTLATISTSTEVAGRAGSPQASTTSQTAGVNLVK
jgi:hypothetical protein